MSDRSDLIDRISEALGPRSLVWFGIRGEDAAPYLAIPQFSSSFAITAPLNSGALTDDIALEQISGRRVDLDNYDIDLDDDPSVLELRRRVLSALHHPSMLVTYRPSHFLSATHFASLETCTYLGMFKDRQVAFEHKPWVETSLAHRGIPTIPWRYVADEHRAAIRHDVERAPQILRPSRTSGGEGITLIQTPEDLELLWPMRGDHLVSVAPYLDEATPVNVGGCVFHDGQIRLHPASVQIIGVGACTTRSFGYCGNDFSAIDDLGRSTLDEIDALSRSVGTWLFENGYRGAFGVDFLVNETEVLFTELNPRMQGSTAPAAALTAAVGASDLALDHLAAGLGLDAQTDRTLADWAADVATAAHIVVHNTRRSVVSNTLGQLLTAESVHRVELAPGSAIGVEPGGTMARLTLNERVTKNGFSISERADQATASLVEQFSVSTAKEASR